MARRCCLEWSTRLRDQVDDLRVILACGHAALRQYFYVIQPYLSTPAVAYDSPILDAGVV
jgi:hypothetical protein